MGSVTQAPRVIPSTETPYFTPANNGGEALNPADPNTPTLFRPLRIRDVTLKNRVVVSPMCMYSAESDPSSPFVGALTDYHIAHLGQFALKGAGLVFVEAQAVQPNGRISPNDAGLWEHSPKSEQFKSLQRVVRFCHSQGAKVAVQLAHAGRKASVLPPWIGVQAKKPCVKADESTGGFPSDVVGPSGGADQAWDGTGEGYWAPRALTVEEIKEIVQAFAKSAETAIRAGVDVIEVHAAHGYLINQFLSPVTNKRTDEYGGSFENRTRILREVLTAIRAAVPSGTPLFLRISATEWLDGQDVAAESGSWNVDSSLKLLPLLPELGVDLLDVSSGGNHHSQKINIHTNYHIDLAAQLRKAIHATGAKTLVGAVGFITEADQARGLVEGADEAHAANATVSGPEPVADLVLMARQFMREPEWVMNAAKKLGAKVEVPVQFWRAGLLQLGYIPWSEDKGEITACGIPINYNASKEWADKKVVLFSVPGAFTPTCSINHVPGYIQNLPQLKEKGVQVVAVIASNDPFVMSAWGKANNVKGDDILFLTDPDARFSNTLGWASGGRTGRFAIVIDHGKVTYAQIETEKGAVKVSGADAILANL